MTSAKIYKCLNITVSKGGQNDDHYCSCYVWSNDSCCTRNTNAFEQHNVDIHISLDKNMEVSRHFIGHIVSVSFIWWQKYACLVKTTQTCWMSLTNFTTLRCKEYPEKNTVWRTCQKSLTNVTTYSSIEYVFPSYNRGVLLGWKSIYNSNCSNDFKMGTRIYPIK
jgi:hypothetical protein